jgi:hypothetical protein
MFPWPPSLRAKFLSFSELQSTLLLIAAVVLALPLLAAAIVLGIAGLRIALALLLILLVTLLARFVLVLRRLLRVLLVALALAALLAGIPVFVCHWDVSSMGKCMRETRPFEKGFRVLIAAVQHSQL